MEPTPEKDVGWKIKRLHSAYAQFRERDIQILDLTSTQAYLLGYLSRHSDAPVYAGDIGRDTGLRHPTVSGLLSRMEQKMGSGVNFSSQETATGARAKPPLPGAR